MDIETKFFPEGAHEKIEKMSREAPAEGVAIYVSDQTRPVEICLEDEFIIGRSIEGSDEKVVDLSLYDAYNQGVSRRHLMIRRNGKTCTVLDLNSTNGTRVNGQSLHPQRPFPVKSGSQIRLGKMHIFIVFR